MSLQVAKRKKKWKQKEDQLRTEKAQKVEGSSTSTTSSSLFGAGPNTAKGRQPKQIFSYMAASGVLTNDLVDIMATVKETGKSPVLFISLGNY